jgi:hypothetical protein
MDFAAQLFEHRASFRIGTGLSQNCVVDQDNRVGPNYPGIRMLFRNIECFGSNALASASMLTYASGSDIVTELSSTSLGIIENVSPACSNKYFRRGDLEARINLGRSCGTFMPDYYQMK